MKIKLNIVNNRSVRISPLAFGTTFSNLSELFLDETPEKTFENMGVYVGKKIVDYDGTEYKVLKINETNNSGELTYMVDIKQL